MGLQSSIVFLFNDVLSFAWSIRKSSLPLILPVQTEVLLCTEHDIHSPCTLLVFKDTKSPTKTAGLKPVAPKVLSILCYDPFSHRHKMNCDSPFLRSRFLLEGRGAETASSSASRTQARSRKGTPPFY